MQSVVDDQIFVIGLAELFRRHMKAYEVATLLPLAEEACAALTLSPSEAPPEGYYSESDELARFFRLVRALQAAEARTNAFGRGAQAIARLNDVFRSRAMGRIVESDRVLPRATSPFGEALRILASWSVDALSRQSQQLVTSDDAGLVAVAAAAGDPLAILVARESVALSADVELASPDIASYIWSVSEPVAEVARRFVSSLRHATGIDLPIPSASEAGAYGEAATDAKLIGRCILVGERRGDPHPFYHWYVHAGSGADAVKDFWSSVTWTTDALRREPLDRRPASGSCVGAPGEGSDGSGKARAPLFPADREGGAKRWLARLFQRS